MCDDYNVKRSLSSAKPCDRCLFFQWMMALQQAAIAGNPVDKTLVNEIGDFFSDGIESKEQDVINCIPRI